MNHHGSPRRQSGMGGGSGYLCARDARLDRSLHLFEGHKLDLTHPFARDAEFRREYFKRDRVVREPARVENAALARVEHGQRALERAKAAVALLANGENGFLIRLVVDQPILPFALAFFARGRVERSVATEAAVHVDNLPL